MAGDRKSVVQVKFRLRKDVLKQLERAAKKADRSVNDEIGRRLAESIVGSGLMELYEQLADTAAKKAASETADKIIKRLRSEIQQDEQDKDSLLGNVQPTIIEGLTRPTPPETEGEGQ